MTTQPLSPLTVLLSRHTRRLRSKCLHLIAGAILLSILSAAFPHDSAWSQAARTIKFIIGVAPGGTSDTLARLLADEIGRTQGVTMIVENRPGAGTVIATEAVSRAMPDGNTILFVASFLCYQSSFEKAELRSVDQL